MYPLPLRCKGLAFSYCLFVVCLLACFSQKSATIYLDIDPGTLQGVVNRHPLPFRGWLLSIPFRVLGHIHVYIYIIYIYMLYIFFILNLFVELFVYLFVHRGLADICLLNTAMRAE